MAKEVLGQAHGWMLSGRLNGRTCGARPQHFGILVCCLIALATPSCRFVAVGIPLDENRVLSQEMHRASRPSERELRVSFSGLAADGHHVLGQAREVGRCKQWKLSRVQVVSTTAYHRRHMPSKVWGWVSTLTGVGFSALGIGLMAANAEGMKGNRDDLAADLQRRRFIGGIWSLLPGLGLAALGITWLALDADKTVVEKGPVQTIREPRGLRDCDVHPLAHGTLQVSPGDSGVWRTIATDGQGRFRLDLLDLLIHLPLAAVPRTFVFRKAGRGTGRKLVVGAGESGGKGAASLTLQVSGSQEYQTSVVEAADDIYPRMMRLLRIDEVTLAPGENAWRVRLGNKGGALVSRALFRCHRHFDLKLSVSVEAADRQGPGPSRGGHPPARELSGRRPSTNLRRGAARGTGPSDSLPKQAGQPVGIIIDGMGADFPLKLGVDRRIFCGPEAVPRLRIAAVPGQDVTYLVRIGASPNAPAGRILRVEGRLIALDKGSAGRVLVGRRGFLYFRGKKAGEFSVIEVTRTRAAARLDQDIPGRFGHQRLTYRLVD